MNRIAVFFVGLFVVAGIAGGVSWALELSGYAATVWGLTVGGLYGWMLAPWVFRGRDL